MNAISRWLPALLSLQFLTSAQAFQEPAPGGEFILADRRQIQLLKEGERLLNAGKHSEAIQHLQRILDTGEDVFFHPDNQREGEYLSLRGEAQRLIGSMPAEGRKIYQQIYAEQAAAALRTAVEERNPAQLVDITRQFFHTPAGYEARWLLGEHHLDQARPLAAALCFEQLRQQPEAAKLWEPYLSLRAALCWHKGGMPDQANAILDELAKTSHGKKITLGSREMTLALQGELRPQWVRSVFGEPWHFMSSIQFDWTLFQGTPARNPVSEPVAAGAMQPWTAGLIFDPLQDPADPGESEHARELRGVIMRLSRVQQLNPPLPRQFPLVLGETLIVRTLGNIRAYELRTGKLRWETMPETALAGALEPAQPLPNRDQLLMQLIQQILYGDGTHGTLSSDGSRLYGIEELGYPIPFFGNDLPALTRMQHNTLTAYHLADKRRLGQRAWTIGGNPNDELFELPASGNFFLGAPLPLAGQLYALGDVGDEIRLQAINAETGQLEWSQPLATAAVNIAEDQSRRLAGTAVAYADGVLVCLTGTGLVAGVDLTTQSLRWGYRLDPLPPSAEPQPIRGPESPPRQAAHSWAGGLPTLAEGRVLLTTAPANGTQRELHCLELVSGRLLWKQKQAGQPPGDKTLLDLQGDELYVAGVSGGNVYVVGGGRVQAYALTTGKPRWNPAVTIQRPSGRGLLLGSRLLVPQRTGTIAVIDVQTGQAGPEWKVPLGHAPGNLISVRGLLISQSADEVAVFPLPE